MPFAMTLTIRPAERADAALTEARSVSFLTVAEGPRVLALSPARATELGVVNGDELDLDQVTSALRASTTTEAAAVAPSTRRNVLRVNSVMVVPLIALMECEFLPKNFGGVRVYFGACQGCPSERGAKSPWFCWRYIMSTSTTMVTT